MWLKTLITLTGSTVLHVYYAQVQLNYPTSSRAPGQGAGSVELSGLDEENHCGHGAVVSCSSLPSIHYKSTHELEYHAHKVNPQHQRGCDWAQNFLFSSVAPWNKSTHCSCGRDAQQLGAEHQWSHVVITAAGLQQAAGGTGFNDSSVYERHSSMQFDDSDATQLLSIIGVLPEVPALDRQLFWFSLRRSWQRAVRVRFPEDFCSFCSHQGCLCCCLWARILDQRGSEENSSIHYFHSYWS